MESNASKATLDFNLQKPQPLFIVISGLSGVGKDAVIEELLKRGMPLHKVVTATTRAPRVNERDGVDYHFLTKERFQEMIQNNELIECALVYNDYKGVPRRQIQDAMASGLDVIMRVDVQGARKFRELIPEALLIFITPANEQDWREMLLGRRTDTPEQIERRITAAPGELALLPIFDYIVTNKRCCLGETVDKIISIITSEHMRNPHRKVNL
ncbi:guanylate kinase [Longilinea arvoryzae]|uniref:Guanylate kinase n=1 Tax=Longilinea arvoryzae TaxID=360412 RepID=A0A0S7BMQ3_9CHLR|nr:guanylate kinase [Longilinea arvoryzae]GAP15560.1 guanylate kinase [Longilinea arvoryzae]